MMSSVSYGTTKSLGAIPFDEAERKVREALQREGFGVLTEIDVQATLKKKLGVDMPPHKILGTCNPAFAHRAMTGEPWIGLLLPCNVVVREEQGEVAVAIVKPLEMFKSVTNDALLPLATEVDEVLRRVLDKIS